jgi:hypothetical protein
MKSRFFTPLLISFFAISCTDNKSNKTENSTDQKENTTSPGNCYEYANIYDTISLKLIHVGESITGTLVYKLKEKDKNIGTIQGAMKGDLLVADYTFMSEGVSSVRQVVFKKQENFFLEGYGDINTNNNRVSFNNPDSLRFNETFKLIKIDCAAQKIETEKPIAPLPAAKIYSNQRFKEVTVEKIAEHKFLVQGKGQIFEASFNWVVEDGHEEIKKGFQMTDAGAPAWGNFKFTIDVQKKNPNSTLHLILFESSAKDGSRQYELPVTLY